MGVCWVRGLHLLAFGCLDIKTMSIINFELARQSAERRRKEREERIKNGQICGTCKHWKLRIDKRVDNWDLPCAQKWGIIDPNDTCHCWEANEE